MHNPLLVTTPLRQSWGPKRDTVFLGQWCFLYHDKPPADRKHVVLPYHWDDRGKAARDFVYLQDLKQKLVTDIGQQLNALHRVAYSERSWNLLIGHWLTQFIAVALDRWTMVKRAAAAYSSLQSIVIYLDQDRVVPNDTEQAVKYFLNDLWNHAFYARIMRGWMDIRVTMADVDTDSSWIKPAGRGKKRVPPWKSALKRSIARILVPLGRWNNYCFVRSGLNPRSEVCVSLKLGCVPQFRVFPASRIVAYDPGMRQWRLPVNGKETEFEAAVKTLIPEFLPKVFLEGFDAARSLAGTVSMPISPKVIFTANSHFGDDIFKLWAVDKLEKGARLVVGQHGGGAFHPFNGGTSHELSVCDVYVAAGNGEIKHPKVRDVGRFNQRITSDKWVSNGPGILVTVAMPRYSFDLRAMPINGQMLAYLEDQFGFYAALPEHIQQDMQVRIYPNGDHGWNQKQRWLDRHRGVMLDEGEKSMTEQVQKCRLLISTYNATTYNESLAANIPTVMYWNPRHWELSESAIPSFEELKSVGIFHQTPESAARQVIRIWDDVAGWWNGRELQNVRQRYCRKFAHLPANSLDRLVSVLRDV